MSIALSNSPAEVVRALLIALNLGTDPTPWASGSGNPWPVVATNEPATPDEVITVYDTVGTDDGRTMTDGESLHHYGIQIRIRSSNHINGWLKSKSILKTISEIFNQHSVTINGITYVVYNFARIGQVIPLGKQTPQSLRSLFTLNCTVVIRALNT
jgi:hypothetical protein